MICYRDMTFCDGDGCCKFDKCPRAITKEVEKKAEELGLPIARFQYPKNLSCYSETCQIEDHGTPELPLT